jgi:hypothetical protein
MPLSLLQWHSPHATLEVFIFTFHIVPKSFSHKEIGHLELPSMEVVLVKLLTNNLCLLKSFDMGVVMNTKGEEMMTSCRRIASFAFCACCSALSLYQALIP